MKKFSFAFLYFLFSIAVTGQENKTLDSLLLIFGRQTQSIEKVHTAEHIFIQSRQSNPKLALEYLHKGLSISKAIKFSEGLAKAYKNLGHYYVNYHNLDSLRYYFKKSESAYKKLKDQTSLFKVLHAWNRTENLEGNFNYALELSNKSIAIAKTLQNGLMLSDAYQQQSTIYLDNGNYKSALEQLINASKVLDTLKTKHPLKEAIIKIGIGRTETLRNNNKEAIPYLEGGLSILEDLKHHKWLAIAYMELGNTHYDLKNYDKALLNYNKGLKISRTQKWDNFIAPYLENIGAVFLDKKDYDKALEYFFNSNKISSKHGSVNNQIIYLNDVASAYLGKKDYNRALNYYTQAIQLADSIGSLDNLSDNYKERAEAYREKGDYRNAITDYKKHMVLNDSLFNTVKAKQIDELKTQYETEKKEQEIQLQNKEIDLLRQKEKNNNLQRLLLGIGLLLSLLGFYAVRQKLKRNKLEKEKVESELAFKKKELTTHALHLAKKNEVLEGLKQKAKAFKASDTNQNGYQQLIQTINFDLKDDNNWENFSKYFQEVHKDFNNNVKQKFPEVTSNELRLMSLLKMNLSSKEIANILNISPEGIKKARYRLRKKLDIATEDSLQDLVLSL
ncbi:tetratricopeptide repeat protein [Seonamhaeicola sp.]|uniref:tetratricopeptide repeat protein n=1 Tax=Seonamhaeicola sp. TaxID=1912245 RepID=UPI00260A4190|nr:tetratricopeptide repeat protein [Seonamhaeicola sp.]